MFCLGIESTAHTFGVGIISNSGKIYADKRAVYHPALGMGIKPRDASKHHCENGPNVLIDALKESKIDIEELDLIAFSRGPGLPNCLQISSSMSRYLSQKYKKPLIGINHCVAHIEIGKLMTKCKDPVIVYCSGGNTQIIAYTEGRYRIFGETEDIPIGNAFDVLARYMGVGMPGGPKIEELAREGNWVDLPYVVKGMDLSFAGIITECKKKLRGGTKQEDVSYSFQETVYAMLTEVTERALAHTGKKEVLITGGVAASQKLKYMMNEMCRKREAECYIVPMNYAGDNGLMIAWNGILSNKNPIKIDNSSILKDWRTDDIQINWSQSRKSHK